MKKLGILILSMVSLSCGGGYLHAQSQPAQAALQVPILPMEIKFRHATQYFYQAIGDDSRYSQISAVVDDGHSEVILLDRTMNRRAFYSSSQKRIDVLQAHGVDAYQTDVRVESSNPIEGRPVYRIRFQDTRGDQIDWQFIAAEMVQHAKPEVVTQPNDDGFLCIYAPRRATAAVGTAVTIAGRKYSPLASGTDGVQAWYAEDLTTAQIVAGTQILTVQASPSALAEGATWKLRTTGGLESQIVASKDSEGELVMQHNLPDAGYLKYELEQTEEGYRVQSVSLTAQSNTLWLFFDPGLPLLSNHGVDRLNIAFAIAENEETTIARGNLTVHQSRGVERLAWNFEIPESARTSGFETAVNMIPASAYSAP
jgi:hypothetical protein